MRMPAGVLSPRAVRTRRLAGGCFGDVDAGAGGASSAEGASSASTLRRFCLPADGEGSGSAGVSCSAGAVDARSASAASAANLLARPTSPPLTGALRATRTFRRSTIPRVVRGPLVTEAARAGGHLKG